MLNKVSEDYSNQLEIVSIEDLVPEDHLLRKIDQHIDFTFIYDLVEDKYSANLGRPSIDPVILFKIVFIQYLFGIRSMRQTIEEIKVNVAYRWFLGLGFLDSIPHFSTFSSNYSRRFQGSTIFQDIFTNILNQAIEKGYVDERIQFVDATHVKAHANRRKNKKQIVEKKVKSYQQELEKEITRERESKGKKPLKEKEEKEEDNQKEITVSTTDPESGLFHKGEHKEVFAYCVQTSCDQHGWITGFQAFPGNEHDSTTFIPFFETQLKNQNIQKLVMDAGYKTPAILKKLSDNNIQGVIPYTSPKGQKKAKGDYYKREYIYDSETDNYTCPEGHTLKYSTTNREGYRIYSSDKKICTDCPNRLKCTKSKNCQKIITRHIWQEHIEQADQYRLTQHGKLEYKMRKETIERGFGTAKEYHGFRYTNMKGPEKMTMKAALTFTCMNMKKLANIAG